MDIKDKGTRGNILIVEDEDLLRWSIKKFLKDRGFVVEDSSGVKKALKKLAVKIFDVIVTDLVIKEERGLDLIAYVEKNCPESQVIIITGKGSKESAIEALRHGVFEYLEKPFDLELLLINIEKAMEKIHMMKELVRLSRTDGLTGLFNQRYFYKVLEEEIKRSMRQNHILSLILVDVDNFKEYNDRHGHLGGDEALVKIADCLLQACRQDVDRVFRYGGDEFMIILPEADLQVAQNVTGRVQNLCRNLELGSITLSIGLAQLRKGQDITSFIRNADEAMYLAKQMGGNRSVVFSRQS